MQAAIFPGQGSQEVGMGKFLYNNFNLAKETFEEASDTLKQDFKKLCFEGPIEKLSLTENTQPALLLVSTATYKVIKSLTPLNLTATAGHSIGEYAAVVASEGISFADAMRAVRARGQAMQKATPVGQGAMLAIMGLSNEQVRQLCQWAVTESGQGPLEPANFNAPGQVVISGSAKTIQWLESHITMDIFTEKPKRSKLIPLKVSAPFHCSLMKPAQEIMEEVLNSLPFNNTKFPVIQNTDGKPYSKGNDIRQNLVKQVSAPVEWVSCIKRMKEMGITELIEMGTGKVLTGLVKKIDREHFTTLNVNSLEDIANLQNRAKV